MYCAVFFFVQIKNKKQNCTNAFLYSQMEYVKQFILPVQFSVLIWLILHCMVHLLVMLLLLLLLSCFPFIPFHSYAWYMKTLKALYLAEFEQQVLRIFQWNILYVRVHACACACSVCMYAHICVSIHSMYFECKCPTKTISIHWHFDVDIYNTHNTYIGWPKKHKIIYTNHARFTYIAYTYAWKTLLFRIGEKVTQTTI